MQRNDEMSFLDKDPLYQSTWENRSLGVSPWILEEIYITFRYVAYPIYQVTKKFANFEWIVEQNMSL